MDWNGFECLVNSEVFQTFAVEFGVVLVFECLVNSEVFQTGEPYRKTHQSV